MSSIGISRLLAVMGLVLALPVCALARPAPPTLPSDQVERDKTCFYAAVGSSQARPGLERLIVMQYFTYAGARGFFGSKVTLANLLAMGARMKETAVIAQALPMLDQCFTTYPLARSKAPVKLPEGRLDQYVICETANRTLVSSLTALLDLPIDDGDREPATRLRLRSGDFAAKLARLSPDILKTAALTQAQVSAMMDDTVPKLVEIGRSDRILEACEKAFKT